MMQGFSPEFATPEQYIIDITYRIWEERGIGRIHDWYATNCPVHTPHGVTNSVDDVVKHTLETMAEFPNRDLLAEDVIIGEKGDSFLSSHRVRSPAVHMGNGAFGEATHRQVYRLAIADCLCQNNQVVAEWLLADNASVAAQLGLDPVAHGRAQGERNPDFYTIGNAAMRRLWNAPGGFTIEGDAGIAAQILHTYDAIWNDKNLQVMQADYDRAVRFEGFAGQLLFGRAHVADLSSRVLASMPDGRFEPHHVIVRQQENRPIRVALRWSFCGTHSGHGHFGLPTGVPIALLGITHFELRDGKIVNEWLLVDETAVHAQIAAHTQRRPVARRQTVQQENKQLVWDYWQAMNGDCAPETVGRFLHPQVEWHGFRPLRRLTGSAEITHNFWQPLRRAMPDLHRRPYLFIGGHYADPKFGTGDWVCGTGDFVGTLAADLQLGDITIPTDDGVQRRTVHFRFGEFCRVENGRIVEIRCLIDLPELLRQCGVMLLPANFGRDLWVPGPLGGDGVCLTEQPAAETEKTYRLVTEMIFGGLNKYDGKSQASQGLERFWHQNMVWHGPVGIGSAYGMDEFKQNAQGPIVRAFPDRRGVGHQARIAEGRFAASTGWPSLGGTHLNRFMNWEPTGERIGWNIMDFWKRDGEKLLENWVMIDLIDAALASKVDLLKPLRNAQNI